MELKRHLVAAAIIALFTAGAAATHASRATSATGLLVTAMKADDGVPHDLLAALEADEGVPHNLVAAADDSDRTLEHRDAPAKHLAAAVDNRMSHGLQAA